MRTNYNIGYIIIDSFHGFYQGVIDFPRYKSRAQLTNMASRVGKQYCLKLFTTASAIWPFRMFVSLNYS